MKILANEPIVKRTYRRVETIRTGRGYSKPELKEVGLSNLRIARNRGIRIDVLRNTSYPENIEKLRNIMKSLSHPIKSVGRKRQKKTYKSKETLGTKK